MTPAAVARPISIARALFPPWVEVDERDPRDVDAASALMPAEAEALGAVAPKRLREHAAGRLCAHAALGRLGARGAPLLNDADRIPRWPEGVVGTISHTRAWCVAAVARASDARAIGVDVEHESLDGPGTTGEGGIGTDRHRGGVALRWHEHCGARSGRRV